MKIDLNKLYNDQTIKGENFLTPFKNSVEMFGRSFKNWSEREKTLSAKMMGLLTRIADFVAGLFCMIGTSVLVPVGMTIKFFSQPKAEEPKSDPKSTQDTTPPTQSTEDIEPESLVDEEKSSLSPLPPQTEAEPKSDPEPTVDAAPLAAWKEEGTVLPAFLMEQLEKQKAAEQKSNPETTVDAAPLAVQEEAKPEEEGHTSPDQSDSEDAVPPAPSKAEVKTTAVLEEVKAVEVKVVTPEAKPKEMNLFIENVLKYPGDLSAKEKEEARLGTLDENTLKVTFNNDSSFHFTIRNQDLFDAGAQVIVNAANTHLGGGKGIDGAIHDKGGAAYAEAHKGLKVKYNSGYTQGFASIITSGALKESHKIEHVIVVAGPAGKYNVQKAGKLYSCYYNALVLAHQAGIERIAFPSISTGLFNFPKDRAAEIVLRAVHDFQRDYSNTTLKTISVHFLSQNPEIDFQDYQKALQTA